MPPSAVVLPTNHFFHFELVSLWLRPARTLAPVRPDCLLMRIPTGALTEMHNAS